MHHYTFHQTSQIALVVKNQPASAGDTIDRGSVPGSGRSTGVGNSNPLQYSCLENSMNRRSLESFSPWGHKELDITEHLSTYIPPAVYEGPSFSTSLPTLVAVFLFGWLVLYCNHPRKYEVLPHLDFDSHFLSSYWYQASFHILTSHCVSSLEKCLFRSLPIFNWVICLLVIAFAGQLLKKKFVFCFDPFYYLCSLGFLTV